MPREAQGHVNAALADLSVKVMQSSEEYNVHRALFPAKTVQKMSDVYYVYNTANSFRRAYDIRANGAESNRIRDLDLSQVTYQMAEHSLHEMVSDRDRENADTAVQPEMDAVQDVTTIIARNKEVDCALKAFTSTSFSGGNLLTLSSNAWDLDTTTSSPIDNVDTARSNVLQNTGKAPNAMVVGFNTWQDGIKDHADILDRIKYSERGIVSEDIAAAVFGLDRITVGKGITRTTNDGISATTGYIFQSKALIYYNETNPRLRSQNFGVTFQRNMPTVERFREDLKKADRFEVSHIYDQRIVLSLSGYLIAATD